MLQLPEQKLNILQQQKIIKSFNNERKPSFWSKKLNSNKKQKKGKRELIRRTLAEDYPGLDYLGVHSVLNARYSWYRRLWFTILTICLLIGLFTIYRIINEYIHVPSATLINVKSVEKLLLPQLTVCPTNAATVDLVKLKNNLFVNNIEYLPEDVFNFAFYMIAGSGFQKMNVTLLDKRTRERMDKLYLIFRGKQSIEQFFHFFFNNFGLQCNQFFQHCQLGDTKLDCCKIFEPIYLIRRGRCFRSISLYQKNFDELGKLRIQLMHPNEINKNIKLKEIIAFIAEHKPQIAPFPRYYLYPNIWTKMRLSARRIKLFPATEVCSDEFLNVGKDICYIERWIQTYLEGPLNCTYPYMNEIRPTKLESCDPNIIIKNYANAVENANYTIQSCILPCDRWEYTVSMEKIDTLLIYGNSTPIPFIYRIDISYNDLQFELIEEVATVSFMGLIAQIGGQMSLFMGSSILTLTQAIIMSIILIHRFLKDKQRQRNVIKDVNNNELQTSNGKNLAINEEIVDNKPSGSIPLNTIYKSKNVPIIQKNFDGRRIKL